MPYGISTRTPISETDYNLHKSNSTYFTDLDIARTALVSRIYSPGVGIVSKQLNEEFKNGSKRDTGRSISIVLGSVFCSFKREIKPFELYEIQSNLIAWDQKWAYIISFFLRPASRKGGQKTLLATAVSKYVVKKGRLTIAPERLLHASGFLPARPEGQADSTDVSGIGTPASGEGITAESGVDGSLVREVLKLDDDQIPGRATLEAQKKVNSDSWYASEWTWERIEQERRRGLSVVEGYSSLDAKIHDEWKQ